MRPNIRLNVYSVASSCIDSYLRIADSIYTFKENHRFIDTFKLVENDNYRFLSIVFIFVDSVDFIARCNYVLSFYDSVRIRYYDVSHVLNNFSAHSK